MKSLKNGLFNSDALNEQSSAKIRGGKEVTTVVLTRHNDHYHVDGVGTDNIEIEPIDPGPALPA